MFPFERLQNPKYSLGYISGEYGTFEERWHLILYLDNITRLPAEKNDKKIMTNDSWVPAVF